MKKILSLRIPAKLEEIRNIEWILDTIGASQDWDHGLTYQIRLVLEELATNTIKHGYRDHFSAEDGMIEIGISTQGDFLTIGYSDNGTPFNPFEEAPRPDIDAAVAERRVGGLGVHFVRAFMDEVGYSWEGGRNHITLKKRRSSEG